MKPSQRVAREESVPWMQSRLAEALQISKAFSELMNVEFSRAWGAPGEPGDEAAIVHTCRLFAGMCHSAVDWEESVRFTNVDSAFNEVKNLLFGIAGGLVEEANKVPEYLSEIFATDPNPGEYKLSLVLDLPEGWNEALEAALQRAADAWIISG
ncbi:MAG TPA: hypothetical protein VF680_11955 [Allosphingosinicella sp.]|jgi:hypothetical protein